jgi:hypothetical protein
LGGRRPIIISWHRFYSPETGRYVSADPIGLLGENNLYAYVENDPTNFIDPWGLVRGMPGGKGIPGGKVKCAARVAKWLYDCGKQWHDAEQDYSARMSDCQKKGMDCVNKYHITGQLDLCCEKFTRCANRNGLDSQQLCVKLNVCGEITDRLPSYESKMSNDCRQRAKELSTECASDLLPYF